MGARARARARVSVGARAKVGARARAGASARLSVGVSCLQLGQHMTLAEVGQVDEAVGLRRAESRGRSLECERDD